MSCQERLLQGFTTWLAHGGAITKPDAAEAKRAKATKERLMALKWRRFQVSMATPYYIYDVPAKCNVTGVLAFDVEGRRCRTKLSLREEEKTFSMLMRGEFDASRRIVIGRPPQVVVLDEGQSEANEKLFRRRRRSKPAKVFGIGFSRWNFTRPSKSNKDDFWSVSKASPADNRSIISNVGAIPRPWLLSSTYNDLLEKAFYCACLKKRQSDFVA